MKNFHKFTGKYGLIEVLSKYGRASGICFIILTLMATAAISLTLGDAVSGNTPLAETVSSSEIIPDYEINQDENLEMTFQNSVNLILFRSIEKSQKQNEIKIPVWGEKKTVLKPSDIVELYAPGFYEYEAIGVSGEVNEKGHILVLSSDEDKAERAIPGVATADFPLYNTSTGNLVLHPKAGKSLYQIPVSTMSLFTATRQVVRNDWYSGSSWAYSTGGTEPFKCGGYNTYRSGGQPADYNRWRVYMKFDLSSIPVNAVISDAYIYIQDMREHGWGAERTLEGTPLDKHVAIATGTPLSWSDIDSYPLSSRAKNYSLARPVVDPWGIPGTSDIRHQRVATVDLVDDVKAWHDGSVDNNGLILNALSLSSVNPSYPSYNLGHPMKECYVEDIYSERTFLVVELTIPPDPVQITSITSTWPDKVELTWEESSSSNFTGYKIFRKTTAGVDITSPSIAEINRVKDVTYTDESNLNPDTTYYYRVAVYDASGLYALSDEKSVTTPNFPTASEVTVTATGMQSVSLSWTACSDSDFSKYVIYWGYNSNVTTYGQMAAEISDANTTALTVTPLGSGTNYYFAIFTYNSAGVYIRSNVVQGYTTPYSPPVAPVLTATVSPMKVTITWTPTAHELFGSYQIFRSTMSGVSNFNEMVYFTSEVNVSSFTDEVTVGNTPYYYIMYVYDLTSNVPNYSVSNEVNGTPPESSK